MTSLPPKPTKLLLQLSMYMGVVSSLLLGSQGWAIEPSVLQTEPSPNQPFSVAQISADAFPVPSSLNQTSNPPSQTWPSANQFPNNPSGGSALRRSGTLQPIVVDAKVTPLPLASSSVPNRVPATKVATPNVDKSISASAFPVPTLLTPIPKAPTSTVSRPQPPVLNRPVSTNLSPDIPAKPVPSSVPVSLPATPRPISQPLPPRVAAVATPPPAIAAPPVVRPVRSVKPVEPRIQPVVQLPTVKPLPNRVNNRPGDRGMPIQIPVPPPNPAPVPAHVTNSASPVALGIGSTALLPVPPSRIPVGFTGGGGSGTKLTPPSVNLEVATASPYPTIGALRYRVVVRVANSQEQLQLKSIAPSAFQVFSNGQPVMQAGVFTERSRADELRSALTSYGLNAKVEALN